jgi:hypothetical protein
VLASKPFVTTNITAGDGRLQVMFWFVCAYFMSAPSPTLLLPNKNFAKRLDIIYT